VGYGLAQNFGNVDALRLRPQAEGPNSIGSSLASIEAEMSKDFCGFGMLLPLANSMSGLQR